MISVSGQEPECSWDFDLLDGVWSKLVSEGYCQTVLNHPASFRTSFVFIRVDSVSLYVTPTPDTPNPRTLQP